MNLRAIANNAIQIVNPNITVSVKASTGFTIGAGGKQQPSYAAPVVGQAQLQAMTYSDLKKTDGLNLQGVNKSIYLYDSISAVVQPNQQGGDLIILTLAGGCQPQDVGVWLTRQVLENWPQWSKVVAQFQGAS